MFDRSPSNSLTAKLPGRLRAYIFRDGDKLSASEPVYAINWFNTKTQWVYDFYNFLAVKAVEKIGGGGFFKGKHIKTLHGEGEGRRDVLLVVRYPALESFKTMLEDKYFQLVSLIRIAAVKDFTFGLSKRVDGGADFQPLVKTDSHKGDSYAIHHYSGPAHEAGFAHEAGLAQGANIGSQIQDLIESSSVELFFSSQIKAHIGTGKTPNECALVDCIIDNIVILRAPHESDIISLTNSAPYQDLIKKTDHSFIGIYSRIL